MTNIQLAEEFAKEFHASGTQYPLDRNEWRAISMFAEWLDKRPAVEPLDSPVPITASPEAAPAIEQRDRSIKAVIERLRFGDSDGDDHDIAAAKLREFEVLERENAALKETQSVAAEPTAPPECRKSPDGRHSWTVFNLNNDLECEHCDTEKLAENRGTD